MRELPPNIVDTLICAFRDIGIEPEPKMVRSVYDVLRVLAVWSPSDLEIQPDGVKKLVAELFGKGELGEPEEGDTDLDDLEPEDGDTDLDPEAIEPDDVEDADANLDDGDSDLDDGDDQRPLDPAEAAAARRWLAEGFRDLDAGTPAEWMMERLVRTCVRSGLDLAKVTPGRRSFLLLEVMRGCDASSLRDWWREN